jgi:hypothetical protein
VLKTQSVTVLGCGIVNEMRGTKNKSEVGQSRDPKRSTCKAIHQTPLFASPMHYFAESLRTD